MNTEANGNLFVMVGGDGRHTPPCAGVQKTKNVSYLWFSKSEPQTSVPKHTQGRKI